MSINPHAKVIKPDPRKTDQVYAQIRHEIENGTLPPGQRMSEVWLVEHTGASRTPVRDALRRLAADELVILEPRQAPMVTPLSLQTIRDLFEFRRVVEVAALENISSRVSNSPEIQEQFGQLSTKFNKLLDSSTNENFQTDFRDLTSNFDELVSRYCNNQFLEKSISSLKPHTTRLRLIAHADHDRLRQSITEHIDMCNAVTAGDLRTAGAACRQHLIHVEQSILNALITGNSPFLSSIDLRN